MHVEIFNIRSLRYTEELENPVSEGSCWEKGLIFGYSVNYTFILPMHVS